MKARWWFVGIVVASGLIAFVGCLPVFDIVPGDRDWDELALLTMPGILLAAGLRKLIHVFNAWTIFGCTWFCYALIFALAFIAWRRFRVR